MNFNFYKIEYHISKKYNFSIDNKMMHLVVGTCNLVVLLFAIVVVALATSSTNSIYATVKMYNIYFIFVVMANIFLATITKYFHLNKNVMILVSGCLAATMLVMSIILINEISFVQSHVKTLYHTETNRDKAIIGVAYATAALALVCGVGCLTFTFKNLSHQKHMM